MSQVWLKVEEEQWRRAPSKWGEKKSPLLPSMPSLS
jgi:hypothetical protein